MCLTATAKIVYTHIKMLVDFSLLKSSKAEQVCKKKNLSCLLGVD